MRELVNNIRQRRTGAVRCAWESLQAGWSTVSQLCGSEGKRIRMARLHATVLREIAPQLAEAFRTDPEVAALFDPAVFIGSDEDDCAAAVVERLQLAEVMSGVKTIEGHPIKGAASEDTPIAVLVMDKTSATFYQVSDPRTAPETWPWIETADNRA